jgi:hypothetical protein
MPSSVPTAPCPVCRTPADTFAPTGDSQEVFCPRCGLFRAAGTLLQRLRIAPLAEAQHAYASSWIRERAPGHPDEGPPFELAYAHDNLLRTASPPSVAEQADRLFAEVVRRHPRAGLTVRFQLTDPALLSIAWAVDAQELHYLVREYLLQEKRFLSLPTNHRFELSDPFIGAIAPAGWAYIQSGGVSRSTQCFIAMWFHDDTLELRDRGLRPASQAAGYRPFLVNESPVNKPIDAEIVANIRKSRLMIADLHCGDAGQRGSVYFEAGYAMGHGIPVYWTCKQDDLDNQRIHFDVRQYVFTTWGSDPWDVFVRRLSSIVEANEGAGPLKGIPQ